MKRAVRTSARGRPHVSAHAVVDIVGVVGAQQVELLPPEELKHSAADRRGHACRSEAAAARAGRPLFGHGLILHACSNFSGSGHIHGGWK